MFISEQYESMEFCRSQVKKLIFFPLFLKIRIVRIESMKMKRTAPLLLVLALAASCLLPGSQAQAEENQNEETQVPYAWIAPSAMNETITDLAARQATLDLAGPVLTDRIETLLSQDDLEGLWSVYICLEDGTPVVDISGEEPMTAASTIKLFVAAAVMDQYETLCDRYGQESVDGLLKAMLVISDNDSATELVSMLGDGNTDAGKSAVNTWCEEQGYTGTFLGILFTGVDYTGSYNATSAQDTARFMCALLGNQFKGADRILTIMGESQRLEKIPSALPENTRTANKTGELDFTENDTCVIFGDRQTYVVSVLSDEVLHDQAIPLIQEISAAAWDVLGRE